MASAQDIADALGRAGYTGDMDWALRVACAESGGNESARNSLGCWGLFQFCPTNSEFGNVSGNPSLDVQAQAFVRASGNGSNHGPWVSSVSGQGSSRCQQFAAGVGTSQTGGAQPVSSGGGFDVFGMLRDAINASLGSFFGRATMTGFVVEFLVRAVEVLAGVLTMAVAAVMLLDVISTPASREGTSVVRSALRKVKQGAETAAMVAVAA